MFVRNTLRFPSAVIRLELPWYETVNSWVLPLYKFPSGELFFQIYIPICFNFKSIVSLTNSQFVLITYTGIWIHLILHCRRVRESIFTKEKMYSTDLKFLSELLYGWNEIYLECTNSLSEWRQSVKCILTLIWERQESKLILVFSVCENGFSSNFTDWYTTSVLSQIF